LDFSRRCPERGHSPEQWHGFRLDSAFPKLFSRLHTVHQA
jgi:hypothetical protein